MFFPFLGHCLLGIGFASRTQVPENQNISIKEQFVKGSGKPKQHIFALSNEMQMKLFRLLCSDLEYGPCSDSVAFNDVQKFYDNLHSLSDKIAAPVIRHNIIFRGNIQRLGQTFDRMLCTTLSFGYLYIYIHR